MFQNVSVSDVSQSPEDNHHWNLLLDVGQNPDDSLADGGLFDVIACEYKWLISLARHAISHKQ